MNASIVTIPTALTAAHQGDLESGRSVSHPEMQRDIARSKGALMPQPPRTRLKLTRRGRAVLGTLATLAVLAGLALAAMFSGAQAVATAEPGSDDFGYVIVQPGASLWQVASEIDPAADPRDLVAEIVRLNQLESSGVQAGQPVALPLRYADTPGVVSASELGL